ncbi:DMT family transporter [Paraflavitalea speifideaquila]|uniref:DMT family transporter n=1 Tax=Paraflavitalea speifideaquila TaxID=3076558 RepID=UPI0028EEFF90|nr:EamA family transporter [Paraflavitalea speifideiaquila]
MFFGYWFFTAIFEPIITRKRINLVELLLGLITIAGISLIFHFDSQYKTGIIVGLISAFLGCLFPIFNRQLLQRHRPETVTLYELSGGFLFLCLLLPFYLQYFPPVSILPTWSDLGWLLILSWLCTVWAFKLSMGALQKISAFTVNLSYNLEPLYSIALAFLLFREDKQLSGTFYIGLLLIIISVILQSWFFYRAHKRSTVAPAG